ncbi:MAG: hypothetical protein AAGF99_00020 [Bacteroidota bacterium]
MADAPHVASLSRWHRVRTAALAWAADFSAPERRFDLVATMTIVLLVLYTLSTWYMQAGVLCLGVFALLHRPILRSALFWFAVTFILAVGHYQGWFYIDNHKYLITYWCLAIALSRLAGEPDRFLALNGRLLIGLAFLFAVVWKLISEDYMSGAFFEATLLQDPRFHGVAEVVGGASAPGLQENVQQLRTLRSFGDPSAGFSVSTGARVPLLAQVMTWWTILIEAVVTACFLWPKDRGLSRWRDATLLAFILTTYPLAPVVGFAWVLTAMATTQCDTRRFRYWPVLYTLAFLAVMVSAYLPFSRVKGLLLP